MHIIEAGYSVASFFGIWGMIFTQFETQKVSNWHWGQTKSFVRLLFPFVGLLGSSLNNVALKGGNISRDLYRNSTFAKHFIVSYSSSFHIFDHFLCKTYLHTMKNLQINIWSIFRQHLLPKCWLTCVITSKNARKLVFLLIFKTTFRQHFVPEYWPNVA